jgi:hypothetical protein
MVTSGWKLTGNAGTNPPVNFLGTNDNKPLVIKTNGAEAVRIDPAGSIGMGTTTPQVKLHVKGNRIRLESADGSRTLDLRADGAALDLESAGAALFVNGPGQSTFLNPNGGNVGIGTIEPRTTLHSIGRISTGLDFTSAGAITFFPPDGFAWFHIDNGPSGGGRPTGRLRFSYGANPGDNEVLNILQNGLVGIGTSNPIARLTVEGVSPDFGGPGDSAGIVGRMRNPLQNGRGGPTAGVRGINDEGHGVQGQSERHIGVEGTSDSGTAIFGESQVGIGIWGKSNSGPFAGFFEGNVRVTGNLQKAGGGFKIDHPLDPANKYLNHAFVESTDMKNVYDGIVILDANGEAIIDLPEWFETLNKDFRYQVTSIGAPGPNLYIADEISNNRFRIAGGTKDMKVSWQVTGIRKDPWAAKYSFPVEEEKLDSEHGFYLHPDLYNQSEEKELVWSQFPKMMRALKEHRQKSYGIWHQ